MPPRTAAKRSGPEGADRATAAGHAASQRRSCGRPFLIWQVLWPTVEECELCYREEARNADCPQYTDHCFTGDYPTGLTDLAIAGPKRFAMLAEAD